MKKLKLSPLAIGSNELLSREQMKSIVGGLGDEGSSGEWPHCFTDLDCGTRSYTCPGDPDYIHFSDGKCYPPAGQGGWYNRCHYSYVCQP